MGKSFGAKIPVLFFISLSCPHLISLSLHVYFFLPSLRHLLLLGLVLSSCSSTQSSQTSSLESLYDFPVPVTITYYLQFCYLGFIVEKSSNLTQFGSDVQPMPNQFWLAWWHHDHQIITFAVYDISILKTVLDRHLGTHPKCELIGPKNVHTHTLEMA